ncbi:MAG: RIP metalloprotease RseP [Alphaproteobacteria bacterium]|nr:RIP metalloprotease RseP [Alphaproteobacteria bacterium]
MTPVTYLLAGLFMIGFLVLVHELGHFVAAKVLRIGVPVFSIGMGPRIFGWTSGGTDYRISALPVGGYVQLAGADPYGEQDTEQFVDPEEDFMRRPVWQRLIVMAAGPLVNLALPFVLFTFLLVLGRPDWASRVGTVLPGTPAEQAGLVAGDLLTEVDGEPVQIWHDVEQALLARVGTPGDVALVVERDGATLPLTLPASALATDPDGEVDLRSLGAQAFFLSTRVGVEASASPAGRAGLRTGDRILAVDGEDVETWSALLAALDAGPRHALRVERPPALDAPDDAEAEELELVLDRSEGAYVAAHAGAVTPWGFAPVTLFASGVEDDAPAARAGVQAGDRFLAVDGKPVLTFHHFIDLVARTNQGAEGPRPLDLTVVRDGALVEMEMTPEVRVVSGEAYSRPIIGVSSFGGMGVAVDQVRKYYSLPAAVPRAFSESMAVVRGTAAVLGNIFTGRADPRDNVGGPVAIFVAAGTVAEQGFFQYAAVIGMISVSLGLINLLPVPIFDGGQILFYLVEWVRGRPLSLELRERFQMVGVVAIVILMLLVTVNDIQRWVVN